MSNIEDNQDTTGVKPFMGNSLRSILPLLIIALIVALLFILLALLVVSRQTYPEISISTLVMDVKSSRVLRIEVEDGSNTITAYYAPEPGKPTKVVTVVKEEGPLAEYLIGAGVRSDALPEILVRRAITIRDYAGILVVLLAIGVITHILKLAWSFLNREWGN